MEKINETKEKTDFFIIISLILIISAFIFSLNKYYLNLDYDILLTISCDPKEKVCFESEGEYYEKILIKAKLLDENCRETDDENCVLNVKKKYKIDTLICEDNLEEGESCVNINNFEEETIK